VYGIVTQSGGHIHVDSAVGRGTAFTICLPRTEGVPRSEPGPKRDPTRVGGGTETVLVAEDEAPVRAVTVRALRDAGYRVLEASCGHDALEIAASEKSIDLLISDVVMPGFDGRALAERLLHDRPGLPVLFVSGYPPPGDERRAIDPIAELLQKPFTATTLLQKVRVVLDAGAARRTAAT
jgi:CheY-like chemotaxis protein